jgi:hypothetical protein
MSLNFNEIFLFSYGRKLQTVFMVGVEKQPKDELLGRCPARITKL